MTALKSLFALPLFLLAALFGYLAPRAPAMAGTGGPLIGPDHYWEMIQVALTIVAVILAAMIVRRFKG